MGIIAVAKIVGAISQSHQLFQLRYREPLFGDPSDWNGVEMLLNNQLSFSQNSRPLTDSEYNTAKFEALNFRKFQLALMLLFFCHPGLNIPGLSVEQLQGIYLGKFTNIKLEAQTYNYYSF
jgi:phosphate transport system substrate-binding protein